MNTKQLDTLGVPHGKPMESARKLARTMAAQKHGKPKIVAAIQRVLADPQGCLDHPLLGAFAATVLDARARQFRERGQKAAYRQWGRGFEHGAIQQMDNACRLPVSVAGALMPDAHQGYGLPIGGVLATAGAVIPFAVGMDIACRMKLSILDIPPDALDRQPDRFINALNRETQFGTGAHYRNPKSHPVMDRDWNVSPVTRQNKDKAWKQLGTSGSGNHFVEFGLVTLNSAELGLEPGTYTGLLSHSGSRGTGALIAQHYSRVAKQLHPDLPRDLAALAWLDLDSEPGQEYWQAMTLMGYYAAANHELIHKAVMAHLGVALLAGVENHHNFAWKEQIDGRDVIVHRKGATPAHRNTLGVIPGSMGTPGYVVRGKGEASSLYSAAHGAGRMMSRAEAKRRFRWNDVRAFLAQRRVTLISAGLDEAPMAYKDIEIVMAAQSDLVERLARFDPRIVKMADA